MSTTTAPPVAQAEDSAISVVLRPEHATHVAAHLLSALGSEFDRQSDFPTRASIEEVKAAIDMASGKLDQIEWGDPDRDVTLALPRAQLERIGMAIARTGADMLDTGITPDGMTYARSRREFQHEFEAGMAILEQLDAQSVATERDDDDAR